MRMAWLSRRFPRRDSRQIVRWPEDTSIGAVPLQAAKWSRPGNRDTSRTSPSTRGGDDRADPEQAGRAGPGRGDGDRELGAGLPDPGIDAAQVIKEGRGQLAAGGRHRVRRGDRGEEPGGLACGDGLGYAAGDQLAQHRVQPAHDLGAGAAQVTVALGPYLQQGA